MRDTATYMHLQSTNTWTCMPTDPWQQAHRLRHSANCCKAASKWQKLKIIKLLCSPLYPWPQKEKKRKRTNNVIKTKSVRGSQLHAQLSFPSQLPIISPAISKLWTPRAELYMLLVEGKEVIVLYSFAHSSTSFVCCYNYYFKIEY